MNYKSGHKVENVKWVSPNTVTPILASAQGSPLSLSSCSTSLFFIVLGENFPPPIYAVWWGVCPWADSSRLTGDMAEFVHISAGVLQRSGWTVRWWFTYQLKNGPGVGLQWGGMEGYDEACLNNFLDISWCKTTVTSLSRNSLGRIMLMAAEFSRGSTLR